MKSTNSFHIGHALAGMALLMLGSSTIAGTTDLVASCGSGTTTVTCANGVSLSGYSTGAGLKTAPTAGTTFATATTVNYGGTAGVGVLASNENSSDTGPHATDNAFGVDLQMVTFSSKVNLTNLTIGWNGTDNPSQVTINNVTTKYEDSDMSVLVWTGTGSSAPTIVGKSIATLLTDGWKLISDYSDVGNTNSQNISSSYYSSYWLISAYSSAYGGSLVDDGKIDEFKLLTVSANTCTGTVTGTTCSTGGGGKVPEPGSLALLGAALVGMVAVRRRKQGLQA